MFDLVVAGGKRNPFHDKTMTPVVVSITGHVVVLSLVVLVPLMMVTSRLPKVPTMMAFVATVPAPPLPPPPPAPRAEAKPTAAPAQKAAPAIVNPNAAPIEAPEAITPEVPMIENRSGEGGVEGGLEGGVPGGIVGGLIAMAPPPPPPPPPAEPAPAPKSVEPVRIGGQIRAPRLLKRVEPKYPDIAVAAKVTGIVILEAVVDTEGNVTSAQLLRSVMTMLDLAAIDAVKQWKYEPLTLNGIRTPFIVTVTFTFSIKQGS